jgi:uncharacterized membrane protein YgaE (UPF0421/DUF939 family)
MNLDLPILILVMISVILNFVILRQQEEFLSWHDEQLAAERKQLKFLEAQLDEKRKQNEYLKNILERLGVTYKGKSPLS